MAESDTLAGGESNFRPNCSKKWETREGISDLRSFNVGNMIGIT